MATILASIALAGLAGLVLVTLRSALLWIFISFFLAVVLNPIVDRLAARVPRWLAVSVVLVGLLATATGIVFLAIPPFVDQARELATTLPSTLERLAQSPGIKRLAARYPLTEGLNELLLALPQRVAGATEPLLAVVGGVFRAGVAVVSVFFLVLFMLFSGPQALREGLKLLHPRSRARMEALGRKIYWSVTRYSLGTSFLALLAGGVAAVILAVAGVPYFLPLGVTMIFLDLIPFAGFVTGGLLVTFVTAATVGWTRALLVLAAFVLYQTLESHLVLPVVHRKTVRVSALGIVVALLIGLELAGILGVLLAVPVAGAIRIVLRELWEERTSRLARARVVPAPPAATPPEPERQAPH